MESLNNNSANAIDPQFVDYLVDKPCLTYVQPKDSALRKWVVTQLEFALGRKKLERVYWRLKESPFDVTTFFGRAIRAGGLDVQHLGLQPNEIKVDGPMVILANHPFGIVDGMVLCDIAAKMRGDFRILINSVLCQDADLVPHFLPVDFENTKRATKTNIRSKQLALDALSQNIPLLVFPSGMVSTASKLGFGQVKDSPWTTFAAKLVRQSKATVLPIHFHGRNSRKFHVASHIAEPLRMGMLMHEALNKFGGRVSVTIGEPIEWRSLEHHESRRALTEALYEQVQQLGTDHSGADRVNSLNG